MSLASSHNLLARTVPRTEDRPPAPFLPMSREEMQALGWEQCDVILVTGDAYVDHPSFGMAIIGRLLESQGFRVGIIAQPDWRSAEAFKALGGRGCSSASPPGTWIRWSTATPRTSASAATMRTRRAATAGKRPDRSVIVYSQRAARGLSATCPIVIGGIEASLRRIAHFDYWSEKVRRSVLLDAKADLLVYGNAERAVVELAQRLDAGEPIESIRDLRGTAFVRGEHARDFIEIDSRHLDAPGPLNPPVDPYAMEEDIRKADVEPESRRCD